MQKGGIFMSIKLKRLLVIYTVTALIALTGYAYAAAGQLRRVRLTAGYESARAFEAAVSAAEDLSATFKKLRYATDDALGKSLCARALADAESAETALSILPFETQELEKLQGFLGRAGDYAGSLCALTERSLPAEHREHLLAFGEAAADFAAHLQELQGKLHEGSVRMDTLEKPVRNVTDGDTELLSALLLGYEGSFSSPVEFAYEGRYSPAEVPAAGSLKEDEALAVAARAAGVEPRELREEYDYEGPEGRRCYSAGGLLLGVSSRGLEFMGQSRLVSRAELDRDEAQKRAEEFLARMGYADLQLYDTGGSETVAVFRYAPTQDGIMRPDDALSLSVALDDGSIYALDATNYSPWAVDVSWNTDEEEARAVLPEGVEAGEARRLILRTLSGAYLPCWELRCTDEAGESASIYVDAETGRQYRIDL